MRSQARIASRRCGEIGSETRFQTASHLHHQTDHRQTVHARDVTHWRSHVNGFCDIPFIERIWVLYRSHWLFLGRNRSESKSLRLNPLPTQHIWCLLPQALGFEFTYFFSENLPPFAGFELILSILAELRRFSVFAPGLFLGLPCLSVLFQLMQLIQNFQDRHAQHFKPKAPYSLEFPAPCLAEPRSAHSGREELSCLIG